MQLTVVSATGNDVDVQGITIPGTGPGYAIPTTDVTAWAHDLEFNAYIGSNTLQLQDTTLVSMPVASALTVLGRIYAGTITTS